MVIWFPSRERQPSAGVSSDSATVSGIVTNDEAIDPGTHVAAGGEEASSRKDRAWVEVALLRQQVREAGLRTSQTREKLRRWLRVVIAIPSCGILLTLLALATTLLPLRPLALILLFPALIAMSAG